MKTEIREHEEIKLTLRKHWFALVKPFCLSIILLLIALLGQISDYGNYFLIGGGLTILWLIYKIIERKKDIWIVTNFRVINEYGVFSFNSKESPMDKINNVSYHQSLIGRIFSFGIVEIQTAAKMGVTASTHRIVRVDLHSGLLATKNKHMKKQLLIIGLLLINLASFGQNKKMQFLGINILQLPASTINVNYSLDYKPFVSTLADIGYTFGHNVNIDVVGFFLTPHIDLYDGYSGTKHTGGYLKIGTYLNLRRNFEKNNFFHLGLFFNSAAVHETTLYTPIELSLPLATPQPLEHTVYLFGISTSVGYEFKIANRLKSHIDFQLSFPGNNYTQLYGYRNFIPGMGFKDLNRKWFPMLILNLKYRL